MIGIVTALPKEYAAMEVMLDSPQDFNVAGSGAGRRYRRGFVPGSGGGQHIVLLAVGDMGNNAAAIRASLMLQHFPDLKHIIMVGIAGGVPNPAKAEDHVRLGDVVVSGQGGVVQYDFDKEEYDFKEHKPIIKYRNPPRPPSALLLEAVRLLGVEELHGERAWLSHLIRAVKVKNTQRPPDESDVLHGSDDPDRIVPHPIDPEREPGQPRLFVGLIASANKLLKNPKLRDELREQFGVKAVEMESSGIADATWNQEVGYLVVRGICDYCDSHKNDAWQGYAAVVAAAYARGLLASMPAEETETPAQRPSAFNQSGQIVQGNQINVQGDYVDRSTTVNTGGGAYIGGNVTAKGGGKFVGRDDFSGSADRASTGQGSAPSYDLAALRELLNVAFSDEELMSLCFDRFPEVYNNFSTGMSKGQKIQQLLDYGTRREQLPALVAEIRARNPAQYKRYEGRLGSIPTSGAPSASAPDAESTQHAASLKRQLAEARANLGLIEERKAEYVESTAVPLNLIKDERRLRERIAELERELGL
jgi:nucleoside phosphorylase